MNNPNNKRISSKSELYPGLDDELDIAFKKNAGATAVNSTPAIADIIQQKIDEKQAQDELENSTNKYKSPEIEQLKLEIEAIDKKIETISTPDQLKALLDEKTTIVDKYLRDYSLSSNEAVHQISEQAQQEVSQKPENLQILEEAKKMLASRNGPSYGQREARRHIANKASSEEVAKLSLESLDASVLEEAKKMLASRNGPSYGQREASRHINYFSSSQEVAKLSLASLDASVLEEAKKMLASRNGPSYGQREARNHITNFTSSEEIKKLSLESLDASVLEEAKKMLASRNGPSYGQREARNHITNFASSQEMANKIISVLGL